MSGNKIDIYGIGNPLIDLIIEAEEADLAELGLAKGTMHLIDLETRENILRHFLGRAITYGCGGSAPNTLIALASLGRDVAIAGKIANDYFGSRYLDNLPDEHITSQLSRGDGTTGSSIILITPDAERTMNTYLAINREFSKADIDVDIVRTSHYLYFTGYMWDTDTQKDAVLSVCEIKDVGGIVVFDVADPFAVDRNRDEFYGLIEEKADIVFANREEASLLFGTETTLESATRLSQLCDIAVVKDGADGSIVQARGEDPISIPIHSVKAIDTTGAGDMYSAGFLYGMCEGFSLRDSGICASYLASRIVEQRGAQFDPDTRLSIAQMIHDGGWRYIS